MIPESPKELGLDFDSWRDEQREAILNIVRSYEDGKKFFFLNAPTGVGKSLIAVSIPLILKKRSYITTYTKNLQEQYLRDFPFLATIMGRKNYVCKNLGGDCDACIRRITGCEYVDSCEYERAKEKVKRSQVAIFNNAYFLNVMNFANVFDKRDILIIDEAHLVENSLMSFVEVDLRKRKMEELGLPYYCGGDLVEYLLDLKDAANRHIIELEEEAKVYVEERDEEGAKEIIEKINEYERYVRKCDFVLSNLDAKWVVDEQPLSIVLKPLYIERFTHLFFKHADFVILMSATLSKEHIRLYGVDEDEAEYLELKSPFPKENRPLIVLPKYNLNYENLKREEVLEWVVKILRVILDRHKYERGIIHTSSTSLAREICHRLGSDRVRVVDSENKKEVLEWHRDNRNGILVGANLHTGLDFCDDLARFQVIVNLPFPSLGDKQIRERAKEDKEWYITKMFEQVIQAYGRAVRHRRDWAICYLLDKRALYYFSKYKDKLPSWFLEAIKVVR